MTVKVAYLAYPYTDNPKKRTREVIAIGKRLVQRRPEIVPLIPHLHFDIFVDVVPQTWIPLWELAVIQKCDLFILGHSLDYRVSAGMVWEHAYAKLNRIPIKTINELI